LALCNVAIVAAQADMLAKERAGRIAIDGHPPFGMTDDKLQPTGSDVDTALSPRISGSPWRS
jgi:polar amino acid transport system substrate-binding protein